MDGARVADLRREYTSAGLRPEDLAAEPLESLRRWLADAIAARLPEPNAMTLATATPDGRPSARTVLLKGLDDRGLTFYTHYTSRKGRELEANPRAAAVLVWLELERQVCVTGTVERVPPAESDAYFASRPLGSQLGAWASAQSAVVAGREELDARLAELARRYGGGPVPRPPSWGGYVLRPQTVEFWQGRPSRLHDRLRYAREGDRWRLDRLAP